MSEPKKHYPNSGRIEANDKKERDNQPDETGRIQITCPKCQRESQFFINGWYKSGFMSLSFKELVPRQGAPARDLDPRPSKPYTPGPIDPPRRKEEDDQSIPF